MTALAAPDLTLHPSWAAAMSELRAEGTHVNGSGLWLLPEAEQWDLTRPGCARLVAVLRAAVDPPRDSAGPPPGPVLHQVPCHFSWITEDGEDGPEVVGFLALRTRLDAWLLEGGGHIGYSVAPSRRRRGTAVRALGLAVTRAAGLGLPRVLVTCEESNLASARTIEAGGGVYEDSRQGKRRYWIATGHPAEVPR